MTFVNLALIFLSIFSAHVTPAKVTKYCVGTVRNLFLMKLAHHQLFSLVYREHGLCHIYDVNHPRPQILLRNNNKKNVRSASKIALDPTSRESM